MNPRRTASVYLSLGICLTAWAPLFGAGQAGTGNDDPSMNVLVPGVNSRGTQMFDDISAIRNRGATYRIELVRDGKPMSGPGSMGGAEMDGWSQYLFDSGADPHGTKVIKVRDPNDPNLAKFLHQIATERHSTVVIDMDLSMLGKQVHQDTWEDQTSKAAQIASMLGAERKKECPKSENTILAHSAGTVGLSKLIESGGGANYSTKIAASPQTFALPRDVTIVQSADDLPSTPTGHVSDIRLRQGAASRDTQGWLERGNTVIKVHNEKLNVEPTSEFSAVYKAVQLAGKGPLIAAATEIKNTAATEVGAHQETPLLKMRNVSVDVFIPVERSEADTSVNGAKHVEHFTVDNISTAQIVRVFEGHAGPYREPVPGDKRVTDIDRLKARIKELQPHEGGGVALTATAVLPLSRSDIREAEWDNVSGCIVLNRFDGGRWLLPRMDIDLARTAYRCSQLTPPVYPELSMGAKLAGKGQTATRGHVEIYYKGPIEYTLLGLVMLRADTALGEITYGDSLELKNRGVYDIPGYHSLPELFPAKYARQPANLHHGGVSDRVILETIPPVLVPSDNEHLAFKSSRLLDMRFGNTTPAESAFANIFTVCYPLLIRKITEFAELEECERVVSIFKWLQENNIKIRNDGALEKEASLVFTPHQKEQRAVPMLENLTIRRPAMIHCEYGPIEIFGGSGPRTRIRYWRGHVAEVIRSDGRILTIDTDDLGSPIGVEVDRFGGCVFLPSDQNGYLTCVSGVKCNRKDGRIVSFETSDRSIAFPTTDPWGQIDKIARRFMSEEN